MEVVISYDNPKKNNEWNALCKECGNFVQTTMYSEISAFYGSKSIYIQIIEKQNIVAGVKLNWDVSRRLPFLSKRLSQFGEFVISPYANKLEIRQLLCGAISSLTEELKPTVISVKGFYGGTDLLYKTDKYKCDEKSYGVAYLDLTKSEDELLKNMRKDCRNGIKKGKEVGLVFSISNDSNCLNDMLMETYSTQKKSRPNPLYVKWAVNVGLKYNISYIAVAKYNDEILSANEVQFYGKTAYLTLSGTKRNNFGSGRFIRWCIIEDLKGRGVSKLILGQVAKGNNFGDAHFVNGITDFKLSFGCSVADASNRLYVVKPAANWAWNVLCRMFIK